MRPATLCIVIPFFLSFISTVRAQDSLYFSIVSHNGWFQAIDRQGNVLADSLRSSKELYMGYDQSAEGMFIYMRDYRIGFKDHHNQIVVPAVYQLANLTAGQRYPDARKPPTQTVFFRGQAVVGTTSQTFGIIDRTGRLVADTVYSWISAPEPQSGMYVARTGQQIMILDRDGRNILSKVYTCDTALYPAPSFNDGLLCVMVPDTIAGRTAGHDMGTGALHKYKAGFVDAAGKLVIDTVFMMSSEILGNRNDDHDWFLQSDLVCRTGRAFAASYWTPEPDPFYLARDYYRFESDRSLVNRSGHDLVIDRKGDPLFALSNEHSVLNHHGYLICKTRSSWLSKAATSIYGPAGQVLPVQGSSVDTGENDLFLIRNDALGGYFMDGKGNPRFDKRYDITDPFYDGFAMVRTNHSDESLNEDGDYGLLDTNGRFYSSKKYGDLQRWGKLIIARDETASPRLYGMMNAKGKWIVKPKYRELRAFHNGLAQVSGADGPSGKWGFLNEKFELVVPEVYDRATDFIGTIAPR